MVAEVLNEQVKGKICLFLTALVSFKERNPVIKWGEVTPLAEIFVFLKSLSSYSNNSQEFFVFSQSRNIRNLIFVSSF